MKSLIFNWPHPSSRTMSLGSTQPLTEISTTNIPRGKARPAREADNFTAIREPIVWKMWEPRRLTILWVSMAYFKHSFTSNCVSQRALVADANIASQLQKQNHLRCTILPTF
jgi:hypothetical protein